MTVKPNATQVLGLELEGNVLKGASLTFRRGQIRALKVFETGVALPVENLEEGFVKPLYIEENGKNLKELAAHHFVVTSLPASQVLMRPLSIAMKKKADIDAVLAFQAEPLLPYPIETALLDRTFLNSDEDKTHLILSAVKKDHLSQHLDLWKKFDVEPEIVSSLPTALCAFANEFFLDHPQAYLILHLGKTQTTVVLVHEQKAIAAQSIDYGTDSLEAAYLKDREERPQDIEEHSLFSKDFTDEELISSPLLKDIVQTMGLELARVIYALSKQTKEKIHTLFITGEGAAISSLVTHLTAQLELEIQAPQVKEEIDLPQEELQRFAVSIGEALLASSFQSEILNFRQGEFAYPYPWKRYKLPLIAYAIACVALCLTFYLFSSSYTAYREDLIKEEYRDLLKDLNKSYKSVEIDYAKKVRRQAIDEAQVMALQELSLEEVENRLQFLEKGLIETPDLFPLYPNIPKVSDVLAWLATHPILQGKETKNLGAVQIENFSYTIIKRPEQSKKQEKYQVKIELEFSSPTPKQAREFHDALIAPNDFVDPKAEIKWSSNRGHYKTSFFLKDKTLYPSNS